MPAPLSLDLRQRILKAYLDAKEPAPDVAERLSVSESTVYRLAKHYRTTGSAAPKPHSGGPEPLLHDADRSRIDVYLHDDPSMTHEEMARRFEAETGRTVSRPTMARYVSQWGITRKKSP